MDLTPTVLMDSVYRNGSDGWIHGNSLIERMNLILITIYFLEKLVVIFSLDFKIRLQVVR
jgi:hypothetical protein